MSSRPPGKVRLIFDIIVIYGTLATIIVGVVLWIVLPGSNTSSGGGEDPADYSTCAELATSPGTDVLHAKCVDDDDNVIAYKDSEYGKAITGLANQ